MEIDFSQPAKAERKLEKAVTRTSAPAIHIREDRPVDDLHNAVKLMKDKTSWVKNGGITNKMEQRELFLDGEIEEPEFEFVGLPYRQQTVLEILNSLSGELSSIDQSTMDRYGAEKLDPGDLRRLFQRIFTEFSYWVKLASEADNSESWRSYSEKLWPMVDEETARNSIDALRKLEPSYQEKEISPDRVKQMFRSELEELGMDYGVEVQEKAGCFNIPEEQKLVVGAGENGERMYSGREARMTAVHEVFHAARSFNGSRAGRESGFPPLLGVHTPFYDRTDEGGAVYREHATGVDYEARDFDYHLRLVAAYYLGQGMDYPRIIEKLQELGGSRERSFDLVARNREILRHHIYWAGYLDWQETERKDPMLIGKVNQEWAKKFWKEIGEDGMIAEPEVKAETLFERRE